MTLPSKEDFINDTLVKSVMDAKGCDRAAAVELLEAKYRSMEEVMKNGGSDEEIVKAGMPLEFGEVFLRIFYDALEESRSKKDA